MNRTAGLHALQVLTPIAGRPSRRRRTGRHAPRTAVSGRRGAVALFFLGGMVPVILLAMMLSVDLTRIIDAQRQAAYVAENSAIAGALQYSGQTFRIDTTLAGSAASRTAQVALGSGVMRHAVDAKVDRVTYGRRRGTDTVTVTISYRMEELFIARYFVGDDDRRMSATRTAEVCVPSTAASQSVTRGFCSRPRAGRS